MKWKAFDLKSWSALLSSLVRIKKTADAGASAVSGIGEDLAALAELTARDLAGKQDKLSGAPITILAAGWEKDETADYPHYCDIPVDGMTARDRVKINLAPEAQGAAAACGLCPSCETLEGKVRLRAASVPAAAMEAECWIEQGKE